MLKAQHESRLRGLQNLQRLFRDREQAQRGRGELYDAQTTETMTNMLRIKDRLIHTLLQQNMTLYPRLHHLLQIIRNI